MGFDISHQHVGLNRVGVFLQTARGKGPERQKAESGRQKADGVNEPWRRISDLIGANAETRDPRVRKRCVRKLVAWIERKFTEERDSCARRLSAASLTRAWGEKVSEWSRVSRVGMSLEGVCFRLGIRPAALNALLRETHGLLARELLDGFRIRDLRTYLTAQLRAAADALWGNPGEFAQRRCMAAGEQTSELRDVSRRSEKGAKRSRYFRSQPSEFLGLEPGEEERVRLRELLGKLEELRDENDARIESLAAALGFESAKHFRAACLTVMGRTVEQLERIVAREVVEYYLAAEDRALREICLRDDEFGFRAREMYCGDGENVPEEPFLDRWSANEAGKPEWLGAMRNAFG